MQETLSHYRIVEQIGAGGMGVVYRAHDEHLDCDVALKVLPAGELADETSRKRFRKEALALSKLNHPNIAVVHDFDTQDGTDFLVEELISGLSLGEMLLTGPLPEREIIQLGSQLAEGLAAAHQQGVVHRDLKPANIRVTPDARLKILDFGLAKLMPGKDTRQGVSMSATASLTDATTFAGTLPYMAPEQLMAQKVDARTDIWAAGCVLYEMATGRRPFPGVGPALVDGILHRQPTPATRLNPDLPPALDAVILKCLEKDPALRYVDARDIAVDLHRLIAGSSALVAVPTRHTLRRFLIAAALLTLLAIAAAALYRIWPKGDRRAHATASAPSIAVLPFEDMSPAKDQEYFADGLAEELLNSLARTPGLRVVARTSSFQFRGKNAKLSDIGRELNVTTVLEGSVRRQAGRVRITAELINAADGFSIWSDIFDRELSDIFAVQEEIARAVAGALKLTLLGEKPFATHGTREEAYTAYLQGRYFYQRSSRENLERAIGYFEQAVRLDPHYAPAWVGLAQAYSRQADWTYVPVENGYRRARAAVSRALALDPSSADAQAAMGWIEMVYEWNWDAAEARYRKAMATEPGNATVVYGAAMLTFDIGRFQQGIELYRRAAEFDPLNSQTYVDLAHSAYYMGNWAEAMSAVNKAIELDLQRQYAHTLRGQIYLAQSRPQEALADMQREPDKNWQLFGMALAEHVLGRGQESDAALAKLIAEYPMVNAFQIAEVYALRGQTDLAFHWLDRAYHQRDAGMTSLKGDPLLKGLENDPRYTALMQKMHLTSD